MSRSELESRIAAVCTALGDSMRRRLYVYVVSRAGPVGRDEAAAALGIQRQLAAFHLDKLAAAGLLDVEFRRLGDRRGRGAGRPSKLYRRSEREFGFSVPERRYDLAGQLLARTLSEDDGDGVGAGDLGRVARAFGEDLGRETRRHVGRRPSRQALVAAILAVLAERGFEPRREEGEVVLANCPFHALAEAHPDVVCPMNLELHRGLLAGMGGRGLEARLQREPGSCCVKLQGADHGR